jgi:hypothetical protein
MPSTDPKLLAEYVALIEPHIELAKKAYGSRDTDSPQHAASREYTRLLKEYYAKKGSLLDMAEALGVTYAGLRRRVTTADLKPSSKRPRKKFSEEEYRLVIDLIKMVKATEPTENYHRALKNAWDEGYSMALIAKGMGLSSANPLYYGISRIRLLDAAADGGDGQTGQPSS